MVPFFTSFVKSFTSFNEFKGSGTSLSDIISGLLPGYGELIGGSASFNKSKGETSYSKGPSNLFIPITTICARSSFSNHSAPNGQPEPTIKSQVIPSDCAFTKDFCNNVIHSGLNHFMAGVSFGNASEGNFMG